MKLECLTMDEALKGATVQPFALIICFSGVTLGETPHSLTPEEWLEAHFFGENEDIHFLRSGEKLEAFRLCEDREDTVIDAIFPVKIPGAGDFQCLRVRKYLGVDEDGQCFIAAVRPVGKE